MSLCVPDKDGTCIHCGRRLPVRHAYRACRAIARGDAVHLAADQIKQPAAPGTELSRLLKRFGIEPTPTCPCREMAAKMDRWGPDECSKPERIDEVVAVMRQEAKARNLPFLDAAGRLLVRRAIANARRAAAAN